MGFFSLIRPFRCHGCITPCPFGFGHLTQLDTDGMSEKNRYRGETLGRDHLLSSSTRVFRKLHDLFMTPRKHEGVAAHNRFCFCHIACESWWVFPNFIHFFFQIRIFRHRYHHSHAICHQKHTYLRNNFILAELYVKLCSIVHRLSYLSVPCLINTDECVRIENFFILEKLCFPSKNRSFSHTHIVYIFRQNYSLHINWAH